MRPKITITKDDHEMSWCLDIFSQQVPQEIHGEQSGESIVKISRAQRVFSFNCVEYNYLTFPIRIESALCSLKLVPITYQSKVYCLLFVWLFGLFDKILAILLIAELPLAVSEGEWKSLAQLRKKSFGKSI